MRAGAQARSALPLLIVFVIHLALGVAYEVSHRSRMAVRWGLVLTGFLLALAFGLLSLNATGGDDLLPREETTIAEDVSVLIALVLAGICACVAWRANHKLSVRWLLAAECITIVAIEVLILALMHRVALPMASEVQRGQ